ncbi:MAG: LCP family protein [bacterium]|nr:LCP family protein [bacterium]
MSKKRLCLAILLPLFCIAILAVLFLGWQQQNRQQLAATNLIDEEASAAATPVPVDPLATFNILLLGYGGANHDGGNLADTIILAQVAPHQEKVSLLSLPRDLWVKLPFSARADQETDFYSKINRTLALGNSSKEYLWRPEQFQGKDGGGNLARAVVSEIIGQPVDYYLAVDFSGFEKLINLLTNNQGLTVNVPYSFTDEYYPLTGEENNLCGYTEEDLATMSATLKDYDLEKMFTCRYETIQFNKGKQTLDSANVLKFVRSRHSGYGGGDFGRSQRQQAVLAAVKDLIFSPKILPKLPKLIEQSLKMIKTNLSLSAITEKLFLNCDWANFDLSSQVLSNQNYLRDSRSRDGQYILIPRLGLDNYSEIQTLVATMSAQVSP